MTASVYIQLYHFYLQILPEKYSYHRRFDQDTSQATDCVICMTAIDLNQRSNDCMVFKLQPLFGGIILYNLDSV